MKQSRKWL